VGERLCQVNKPLLVGFTAHAGVYFKVFVNPSANVEPGLKLAAASATQSSKRWQNMWGKSGRQGYFISGY
jgi:hypothetical protein